MRLRSALLGLALTASPLLAQGRIVDEGTFVVLKNGSPSFTESFKITRGEGGSLTATGNQTAGAQQITSSLTTDSTGAPLQYDMQVKKQGARIFHITGVAGGGRLRTLSQSQGGEESTREYPLMGGQTLILEPGLLHQLYFVCLSKANSVHLIAPRAARSGTATIVAKGLEAIPVAGRSVTATHYSVTAPGERYEIWIDPQGRLLKVEAPAQGLTVTREELPR